MTSGSIRLTTLDRVEDLLDRTLDRIAEPGQTGCRRIIGAGGKRLRPELVLRCASITPARSASVPSELTVAAAAAVELLHSATLLHDDLLDGSATRRGVPAVHRSEGQSAAIVAGDALIAQSWRLIAHAGGDDVEDLATALADMCSGEALEEGLKFDDEAMPLDVLRVSQLKTGALLKAACRIGARRGAASPSQISALGTFGSDFGVALQLLDDVLDVISEAAMLGKPCGADFAAGTMTMPTVFALNPGDRDVDANSDELRALLRPDLTEPECARAQQLILRSSGPARTVELARSFARRAARAVPAISPAAAELAAMPINYVERQLQAKIAPVNRWILSSPTDSTDTGTGSAPDDVAADLGLSFFGDAG